MKKLFALILALVLLCSSAVAESDDPFAGLSFDEILALYKYVGQYLMQMPEFKQVTVPEGIYKIGVDIPSGDYEIYSLPDSQTSVYYFDKINTFGSTAADDAMTQWEVISDIDGLGCKSYHFHFVDGNYVRISSAPAVFSTYTGPKFSFD